VSKKSVVYLFGQVGFLLDFHPGGPASTPARGNQQKKFSKKPSGAQKMTKKLVVMGPGQNFLTRVGSIFCGSVRVP